MSIILESLVLLSLLLVPGIIGGVLVYVLARRWLKKRE